MKQKMRKLMSLILKAKDATKAAPSNTTHQQTTGAIPHSRNGWMWPQREVRQKNKYN